jgi:hypothetical protein
VYSHSFGSVKRDYRLFHNLSEAEANGLIGNELLRNKRPMDSVPYLRRYSEVAAELGDAESRCRACSRLAFALESLGITDKALEELSLVQAISEQAGDLLLQAQSYKAMVIDLFS